MQDGEKFCRLHQTHLSDQDGVLMDPVVHVSLTSTVGKTPDSEPVSSVMANPDNGCRLMHWIDLISCEDYYKLHVYPCMVK